MPRKTASVFSQLQQQAKKLVASLAAEIRTRKSELARMEHEFEELTGIAGLRDTAGASKGARNKATRGPRKAGAVSGSRRINWAQVLAKLPKEFKSSDIRKVRGLKDKRASELFAAITRWIDSRAAKKKARGVYVRLK
ncbi:MAG: hypothetical protein ACLQAT_27270 [Candidatus Binataceae bacterium]